MNIFVRVGEPVQFPLHTIFTLDLTGIFLPNSGYYWEFFDASGNYSQENGRFESQPTGEGTNIFIMSERTDWDPSSWYENPEEAPGPTTEMRFYNYVTQEVITIPFLPPFNALAEPADMRGTAGRDAMLYDGEDAELTRIHVVDTSGGSDRAEFVNASGIMLGRAGNDTLIGWNGNDALYGGGGNDRLEGRGADDVLHGMNGNDSLFGGDGNDILYAGDGNDLVTGGMGDDRLYTSIGNDTVRADDGDDFIYLKGTNATLAGSMSTTVFGGNGDDDIQVESNGDKRLVRLADSISEEEQNVGVVTISTGSGNDYVSIYSTSGGTINTGSDNDYVSAGVGEHSDATLNVFLGEGDDNAYGGRNTNIFGGAGDDYIYITSGSQASGGDGVDTFNVYLSYDYDLGVVVGSSSTIFGGLGDDYFYGGINDILHGGDGNDNIQAGRGNNFLYGGNGEDVIYGGGAADWVSGGNDNDILYARDFESEFENNDASNSNDTLNGGGGNDQLFAERAGHSLFGGTGDDNFEVFISTLNSGGDTKLFGGSGNDTFSVGGKSIAEGGDGNDIFTVDLRNNGYTEENTMVILDFVKGEDKLAISSDYGDVGDIRANPNLILSASWNVNEEYGDHTIVQIFDLIQDEFVDTAFILNGFISLQESDYFITPTEIG